MANVRIVDEDAQDQDNYSSPESPNGHAETPPDFTYLFAAPDLSSFLKTSKSNVAREYEKKTAAVLKAGVIGAINAGNFPDAATLIAHGPGFSAATGALADADERAKAAIDFFTTPANPYVLFALTALPMVSQFLRNHERDIAAAPEAFKTRKERRAQRRTEREDAPRLTIHLPFGKQIRLGIRARFPVGKIFAAFRTQTADPRDLTVKVFSDPKIVEYLRRQGVNIPSGNG